MCTCTHSTSQVFTQFAWLQVSAPTSPSLACLPFLPVNPDYGTSRNQARQKLARLDKTEFATLVVDVLKEIRRRTIEVGGQHQRSPLRENPPHLRGPQHKSLPATMVNNRLVTTHYSRHSKKSSPLFSLMILFRPRLGYPLHPSAQTTSPYTIMWPRTTTITTSPRRRFRRIRRSKVTALCLD